MISPVFLWITPLALPPPLEKLGKLSNTMANIASFKKQSQFAAQQFAGKSCWFHSK
jgi:hypothetical protein